MVVDSCCVLSAIVTTAMACYFYWVNRQAARWDGEIEGIQGFYYTL